MRSITKKPNQQGNNLKQEAQSRAETVETRVFLGRMAWNSFCMISLMVCNSPPSVKNLLPQKDTRFSRSESSQRKHIPDCPSVTIALFFPNRICIATRVSHKKTLYYNTVRDDLPKTGGTGYRIRESLPKELNLSRLLLTLFAEAFSSKTNHS
jgi:hypothetical protein